MTLRRMLSSPWRRFMMWRTSMGFGIHSPFAFALVRNVLRCPYPYYAFRRQITSPADRRLFRVVNRFNPITVALLGDPTDRAREVIALCSPKTRFISSAADADFVYLAPGEKIPQSFRVLYAENLPSTPPDAMTFSNGRCCIAIRRHDLPAQPYLLRF